MLLLDGTNAIYKKIFILSESRTTNDNSKITNEFNSEVSLDLEV